MGQPSMQGLAPNMMPGMGMPGAGGGYLNGVAYMAVSSALGSKQYVVLTHIVEWQLFHATGSYGSRFTNDAEHPSGAGCPSSRPGLKYDGPWRA